MFSKDELLSHLRLGRWGRASAVLRSERGTELAKQVDRNGDLPLHVLVSCLNEWNGDLFDVANLLIKLHPEGPATKNNNGDLPIHRASKFTHEVGVITMLAESYPEGLATQNEMGNLPIHEAVQKPRNIKIVRCLVERYQEGLKISNINGNLAIHEALTPNGCAAEIVSELITTYPQGLQQKNEDGRLPIHLAITMRDGDAAMAIAKAFPEGLERRDYDGKGLLPIPIYCIRSGCPAQKAEVVSELVKVYTRSLAEKRKATNEKAMLLLEKENKQLTEELALLKSQKVPIEGALDVVTKESCAKKQKVADETRSLFMKAKEQVAKECESLRSQKAALEGSLATLTKKNDELQNRILAIEKEREGASSSLATVLDEKATVESSLSAITQERNELLEGLASGKAALASAENENVQLKEKVASLQEENLRLRDSANSAKSSQPPANEEKDELEEQVASVETGVEESLSMIDNSVNEEDRQNAFSTLGEFLLSRKSERVAIHLVTGELDAEESLDMLKVIARSLKSRVDSLKSKVCPDSKPSAFHGILEHYLSSPAARLSKDSLLRVVDELDKELSELETNRIESKEVQRGSASSESIGRGDSL